MKEAKEVNWADLRQFAEVLGTNGFKPDRDLNELDLRLDLVTVRIYIDRKAKGAFEEHLRDENVVADMPALAATNLADIVKGVCDGNQINKEP